MAGSNSRAQRIEAQMQRTLAELLARGVKDPRVGSVTVTSVSLSTDGGVARIYFVPFASRHSPAEVSAGLASASGFLRGEVGRQLGLRHAPRLEFVFDTGLERAQSLTELIDRTVKQDEKRHESEPGSDPGPDGGA
jgi:ribosome-binding factor A